MTWIDRSYEVLGATVLVRCRHQACADGIAEHFGPLAQELWTTPDIVVECDLDEPRRELFRTRPAGVSENLDGVRVQTAGSERAVPWTKPEPPLLPLDVEPLRGRFVGLHASLVAVGPQTAVAILGDRGSGKTTLSLTLVADYEDCALMSDEWTFVLRRTTVAVPFPQAVGLPQPGAGKRWRRADAVAERLELAPRVLTHLVLLVPGGPALPEPIDRRTAFAALQAHHLAAGTSRDEAQVTLARIGRVPAVRMTTLAFCRRGAAASSVHQLVVG